MSCVTEVTGTTGTASGHAVDEAKSESKTKRKYAASGHLKDFMDAISHQPSKWEDLEHFHMTHDFWGGFGTYLGRNVKNKRTGKKKLQRRVI